MNTRTRIKVISQRRPDLRKVQKLPQNKMEVHNQQRPPQKKPTSTRVKVIPPLKPATVPRRQPRGVTPPINHSATFKGRIPPYNPNTVQLKTAHLQKHPVMKQSYSSRKTRLKPMARTILYALRLLIVGVGIGAIVGTVLSVLDPATRLATPGSVSSDTTVAQKAQSQPTLTPTPTPTATSLSLSQELIPLKSAVQSLAASNPNLTPGVFLIDLDNGGYVDLNGAASFAAASTIKIPILVAFFQDVDAQKIRLDESLTLESGMVAGGSGNMQYKPVGTQFTALEVATKMMTVSDNTATNMLIARLGGIDALNQRFQSWGLTTTAIRNILPDLGGTNTTSPKELSTLMAMVGKGNLVSMRSRDRILDIMRRTVRNHLLPAGLGPGATIAHKTGNIGTILGDAGLVDVPTGKRYVVSVMVQRPRNDPGAEKLITSISRVAYEQLSQTFPVPNNTGSSIPNTGYQQPPVVSPLPAISPPPAINQPLPNGISNTLPLTGYQPPVMNPPLPNGMSNTLPPTGYQAPAIAPQVAPQYYYNPYQR
ncbi:serine hydrolase [Scytonema hofmannii PCC 7110]|uniref:Serine hydrolase n=1 Tax=Scytonema hofmannii PCC 7110 TaxID=128403 RepID=A0A139X3L3_9CYAN|nr:class A beta-lactamase [Scytonema hofmannii]KYC39264.1 serine hydrolase [Scytonema hofmannii PCC 7110]